MSSKMFKQGDGTVGISPSFLASVSSAFSSNNTEKREWDIVYENEDLPPTKRIRFDQNVGLSSSNSVPNFHSSASSHPHPSLGPGGNRLVNLMKESSNRISSMYGTKFGLGTVSTTNFLQRLKMPWEADRQSSAKQEVNIMQKVEVAFKNKTRFTPGLYNELVNLSDNNFELLLSRHQNMDIDILNMITTYVWAKNAEGELVTENKRKFIAIARYGILPKIISGPSTFRSLFQSYEKLVAIDQELVMDHILMPLLNSIGSFPKILYQGINTYKFLMKIMDKLAASYTILEDPNIINTLTFLIEKQQEYLPPPANNILFKLLEISLQARSSDPKIGSFYYLIMKKFINTMTEDEVRTAASLNYYNLTSWKPHVDGLVMERLKTPAQFPNRAEYEAAHGANYNNNHYGTSSSSSSVKESGSHVNMKLLSEQLKHMSAGEQMDMD